MDRAKLSRMIEGGPHCAGNACWEKSARKEGKGDTLMSRLTKDFISVNGKRPARQNKSQRQKTPCREYTTSSARGSPNTPKIEERQGDRWGFFNNKGRA